LRERTTQHFAQSPPPVPRPPRLPRYDELFRLYARMLQSDNYVLRRQSLKLLSEFLLDRENFPIMMRYIQVTHPRARARWRRHWGHVGRV